MLLVAVFFSDSPAAFSHIRAVRGSFDVMGLGVSRSEHGEAKKRAARDDGVSRAASDASSPRGEMKKMEPRRDGAITIDRLELALTRLVAGQDALIARIDLLEKSLVERDNRLAEMESQIDSSEEKRAQALELLDSLLDQLDELEGRAESAAGMTVDGR